MKGIANFVSPGHRMFETSVASFLPSYIVLPFCQADEKEYQCSLEPGDLVKEGQELASLNGIISSHGADIHSSVPGKIESIEQCTLVNGNLSFAAKIKTQGEFSFLGKGKKVFDWNIFAAATLIETFKSKGIVNTFSGNSVALSTQIRECRLSKDRFVVVRLFDEDQSRYTESFVSSKHIREVVTGTLIAAKAFDAEGIVFVLPKKADFSIPSELLEGKLYCTVFADTGKYPCGNVNSLMRLVRKNSKISEYKPFYGINHRCLFLDSITCLSIYEGVVLGMPVLSRYVHVNGSCLKSSGMFKVRLGTRIRDLVEQCGGFFASPSKIIINGLVCGNAVADMEIPVTKDVKSVTFLSSSELFVQESNPCIRCGKCRAICPEHLVPDMLYKLAAENYLLPRDIASTAKICSGCSLCNSVCPSRISLSQSIALLNQEKI